MKKTKQQTVPKEFPTNLVEEYNSICERLKKHETALIKRFAPKFSEILPAFLRLAYEFTDSEIDEYAALCFLGAARCEKLRHNPIVEHHWLIKAANSFTKAFNRRLELGYPDGDEEFRQGALRCYNDLLTSPNLPENSALRAAIIRQLKKIDPDTEETSTFESPSHRYEDLRLAAYVDIEEECYGRALNKLTDIYEDICERKVEKYYRHLLEEIEIVRLLLLLHLEMPRTNLAPCNIALLERYTMKFDGPIVDKVKESALDPELHLMFRAFYQSIQIRSLKFLIDSFNDIGMLLFLKKEQFNLLNLVFDKYEYEFKVEEGEKECKCFKLNLSDTEDEGEGESGSSSKKEDVNESASTSKQSAGEQPEEPSDPTQKETEIETKVQNLDLEDSDECEGAVGYQ